MEETLDCPIACEQCKEKKKATKSISIDEHPDILVIHLKRFNGIRMKVSFATTTKNYYSLDKFTSKNNYYLLLLFIII